MNQLKIGKFIAKCRKMKNMTQAEDSDKRLLFTEIILNMLDIISIIKNGTSIIMLILNCKL